jgi:hypothetical protein
MPQVSHNTRAKGQVRRYVRGNRLRYLWTLTYERARTTRKEVVNDLRRFFERMRARYGPLPLVAVIEQGKKTGRYHVHFACGRRLHIDGLRAIWRHGYVWVSDKAGRKGRFSARKLASYLSKYVAKELEAEPDAEADKRPDRAHRYLVTQGFSLVVERARFRRPGQAWGALVGYYGEPDVQCPFGDWDTGMVYGIWYAFPDHCLDPPPRGPVKER